MALSAGPELELFIASNTHELERFDGSRLERIELGLGLDPTSTSDVDVEWLGPEEAVAVFADADAIVRFDHGSISIDRSLRAPAAIASIPGFGLVVATETLVDQHSSVYHLQDGDWDPLEKIPSEGVIYRTLWPLGGGFLFGGFRGALFYYSVGLGTCTFPAPTAGTIMDVTRIGDRLFFSTGDRPTVEAPLLELSLTLKDLHPGCRAYALSQLR